MLNFSPKIRLGNLINVMLIKKHAFICGNGKHAEMGTANSLHARRNTASIIKGLVLEYLTRNNQECLQKNF